MQDGARDADRQAQEDVQYDAVSCQGAAVLLRTTDGQDRTVTVLYDEDKDCKRIDQLLEDAGDLSRIYLTVLNCSQNGYDPQAIIDAMNRLIDHKPEPKRLVSNEIIDKFKVRI